MEPKWLKTVRLSFPHQIATSCSLEAWRLLAYLDGLLMCNMWSRDFSCGCRSGGPVLWSTSSPGWAFPLGSPCITPCEPLSLPPSLPHPLPSLPQSGPHPKVAADGFSWFDDTPPNALLLCPWPGHCCTHCLPYRLQENQQETRLPGIGESPPPQSGHHWLGRTY